MSTSLSNAQKKEWARQLFLQGELSQKEIATKVGATEKTIGRWKEKGQWEMMRQSVLASKKEEIAFLYRQLQVLREQIDENEALMNSKQADAVLKITAAIRNLETEAGLGEILEVCSKLLKWLGKEDLEEAQRLTPILDQFVQEQIA